MMVTSTTEPRTKEMAHNFLLKRARKLDLISSFSEAAEGALPFELLLGPELERRAAGVGPAGR